MADEDVFDKFAAEMTDATERRAIIDIVNQQMKRNMTITRPYGKWTRDTLDLSGPCLQRSRIDLAQDDADTAPRHPS